ncbi:MAG: tRNA lysidine(34) synthetase TilS [Ferruginibacter sp.]
MDLLGTFRQYILKEKLFQPHERLLLAVSGGIDSVVLCELCKQSGYDFEIAHCNFQLRGEDSNRDEAFVKALAEKYAVMFYSKTFDTKTIARESKKSIEETARDLRYEWFHTLTVGVENVESTQIKHHLPKYIVTAHHADDNAETVMMSFFRGTGIAGLRGMLPKQGKIIRPLLFARRSELEEFIKQHNLEFVTDHTNIENDYTRNYFRNAIIPLVNKSFPEATKNVLKNIQRFRETEMLYQQSVELHKKKLLEQKGAEVHIPVLKLLKTEPLPTVLYEIIKAFGFTAHQTEDAIGLLKSETGKYIQSASHRIIKNRNWLIISPRQTREAANILIEKTDTKIVFENGTLVIKEILLGQSLVLNNPMEAQVDLEQIKFPLLLRKWKQGDYFYPLGMQKKKKLSRFFIDQKLSLTQKEKVWVLETDKRIIWVVGIRIDDRFKITAATKAALKITICQNEDAKVLQ